MSLFDKEFFPTPKEIAIHMVRPYLDRLDYARILEPSAGNGAILDAITEDIPYVYENEIGKKFELTTKARNENIFCIEVSHPRMNSWACHGPSRPAIKSPD